MTRPGESKLLFFFLVFVEEVIASDLLPSPFLSKDDEVKCF